MPITATGTAEPLAHGGDLSAIRRRFPEAPEPWIDLSTGINPVPYPVVELAAETWSRLPTRQQERALVEAAAVRYGVRDPATIVAAPGTQALIQLLPRLVAKSRVTVLGPTYEEHAHCWARQGHDVAIVSDFERADVTIVVNPNNPTGKLLPQEMLRQDRGLLIVDEAFVDFLAPSASLAGNLPANTIVLRSFGCQRRRQNASVRRSKDASVRLAGRPPAGGLPAFRDQVLLASSGVLRDRRLLCLSL